MNEKKEPPSKHQLNSNSIENERHILISLLITIISSFFLEEYYSFEILTVLGVSVLMFSLFISFIKIIRKFQVVKSIIKEMF